jgi:protein-tyrosine phosphatase
VELFWINDVRHGRLAILPRPRGGDWLLDEISSLRRSGVEVLVSLLTAEEVSELDLAREAEYCAAEGIQFISFPFADRGVPPSAADAVRLVRKLEDLVADGKAVAIHCRQGVGRSAVVAACVLAAQGAQPKVAFELIAKARGCPVPDTPEQRAWVERFAEMNLKTVGDSVLVLSTRSLPGAPALADAARKQGWLVQAWDEKPVCPTEGRKIYYGGSDTAMRIAHSFRIALLEPPLDLLARLPASLLLREVRFARFRDLSRLRQRAFVKPADPLDKCFDAGIYADQGTIRTSNPIAPETPVLLAEPVEWLAEYRCFVRERQVIACSPYLSFGRPIWQPWGQGGERAVPSPDALAVCKRLLQIEAPALPPAFVVDVGLIHDCGWAVVEFNPAWCSSILGANPAGVLRVVERACQDLDNLVASSAVWTKVRE